MRSKDSKSPFDAVTDFNKGSTCGRRVEEQNPETKSRWAQMARERKRVRQFLSEGRYIANVVDGKAKIYGKLSREQVTPWP